MKEIFICSDLVRDRSCLYRGDVKGNYNHQSLNISHLEAAYHHS